MRSRFAADPTSGRVGSLLSNPTGRPLLSRVRGRGGGVNQGEVGAFLVRVNVDCLASFRVTHRSMIGWCAAICAACTGCRVGGRRHTRFTLLSMQKLRNRMQHMRIVSVCVAPNRDEHDSHERRVRGARSPQLLQQQIVLPQNRPRGVNVRSHTRRLHAVCELRRPSWQHRGCEAEGSSTTRHFRTKEPKPHEYTHPNRARCSTFDGGYKLKMFLPSFFMPSKIVVEISGINPPLSPLHCGHELLLTEAIVPKKKSESKKEWFYFFLFFLGSLMFFG